MKILVDEDTQRILGAAILGMSGDEASHCITATVYADAPYTVLQRGADSPNWVGADTRSAL